jgi:hypothetical protein
MEHLAGIDIWIALGVVGATALTDAVCVLYTASVVHRRDLAAANWSSLTYMLAAFAVISFTSNWVYVLFATFGAWIGTYASMKYLRWRAAHDSGPTIALTVHHAPAPDNVVAARGTQAMPVPTLPAGERIAA